MGALIAAALGLAPELIKLVAGEKVSSVVTATAEAIAGTSDPEQIKNLPPDQQAELRKALMQIALQERQAELADLANARAQTISLAQADSKIAWAAPVISTVITLGFFGAVFLMLVSPQAYDERTAVLVNVVLAALTLGFAQVTNYWLGSSSGSKRNGDAVRAMASGSTPQPQPVAIATTGPVTTDGLNDASYQAARGNGR